MELFEAIYNRRSIRRFTSGAVDSSMIEEIIKAGTWAPSGLNNQPWRFAVVTNDETRSRLAELTKYSRVIISAPVSIAVFLDTEAMYHEGKDHQAMGACIQNMLLAAHGLGLGAVWLGEILNNAEQVRSLLGLPEALRLMAVVALGHPADKNPTSSRKGLSEVVVRKF